MTGGIVRLLERKTTLSDSEKQYIIRAVKLIELVKERIKHPSEETCFGIPVDSGIRSELQSLLDKAEKGGNKWISVMKHTHILQTVQI